MAEVNLMKKLDHPNVAKIYETFYDEESFFIVSELCQGGKLFDFIIEKGVMNETFAS